MIKKILTSLMLLSLICVVLVGAETSSSSSNLNQPCQVGNIPFWYKDIWGEKQFRCMEEYNSYGGLTAPQEFFVSERPSFKFFLVSQSDIDFDREKTFAKVTDASGKVYDLNLELSYSFFNSDGRKNHHIMAVIEEITLIAPIRIDYKMTNYFGESTQGYHEDIGEISVGDFVCSKFLGDKENEDALNFYFLSNGYSEDEFQMFDNEINSIASKLKSTPPFNEFSDKINIYTIHNPNTIFTCSADNQPGRLPCNPQEIVSVIEASCSVSFSDNYIPTVFTGSNIDNWAPPSASAGNLIHLSSSNKGAFIHELGHQFGSLAEGYRSRGNLFHTSFAPNLDEAPCKKTCSGELNTLSECYPYYSSWLDCISPYIDNWQSYRDELRECFLENIQQSKNDLGYPFDECNLGQDCFSGTGCYPNTYSDMRMFRLVKGSVMVHSGEYPEYGPYVEQYLRERINQVLQINNCPVIAAPICDDGMKFETYTGANGCLEGKCVPNNCPVIAAPICDDGMKFETYTGANGCLEGKCVPIDLTTTSGGTSSTQTCQVGCVCSSDTITCLNEQQPTITTQVQSGTSSTSIQEETSTTSTISLSKTSTGEISIRSGDVEAVTFENISIVNSKLTMQTSAGSTKEIKVMPEEVSVILGTSSIETLELKEESEKAVYSVSGTKEGKIIAIFPVDIKISAKVDAATGSVISIEKPWWSFLAKEE